MVVEREKNVFKTEPDGQPGGQPGGHFASLFDRYNYPLMQNFDVKKAVF